MKYFAILLAAFALAANQAGAEPAGKAASVFNGKDLSGWKLPKDNTWWRVEDGAIVCQSGPKKKGSNIWTEKQYQDFVVELEFKFDGKGDTGVFLREEKQQVQIGISGSLKRDMTGSMYVAGKGYPKEASEAEGVKGVKNLLKINEWNSMKVEVKGKDSVVWLNGKKILEFTFEKAKEKGPIGLQLHGGKDMRADFRNIKITEL